MGQLTIVANQLSFWRAAAALLALCAALLGSGCAVFKSEPHATHAAGASGPNGAPSGEDPATTRQAAAAATAQARSVGVEIDAPKDLKSLLERYLDLVRLGRLARDDVDDSEWSRLIDATPGQVRTLLQTEGYFAPQVTLARTLGPGADSTAPGEAAAPGSVAASGGQVKIHVVPGARAQVSRVTIEAEGDLQRALEAGDAGAQAILDQLRKAWALPAGSDFRNPVWISAKATALARLRAAGYATAVWSGTGAEVDAEHNAVRLFLVADSGPLFRYGELQIEGLVTQDAATVANLLNTPRGAPVTDTMLLDFQDRLQKSGLFDSITVTLEPDPANAGQARITARLREAPLQTYTFGVGISANTGLRASVEHTWRRAFGLAATAHNKIEYGNKRKAWDSELSGQAGPGLHRNVAGIAIEELESDTDTVLSQRFRVGRAQDGQRVERLYFVETERSLRRTLDDVIRSKAFAHSLNFRGVWRDLDSVILPSRGFSFSGQVGGGYSHGSNAESGPFTRAYGRFTGYLPVGQSWYGQARVELGRVFLRSTMVVPESQQFRAGGDDSVRGYGYRSLGPLVDGAVGSGNVLYTTSLEVARPIVASLPSVWGAVFVDAGNAANSFRSLDPALGVGVGVRWRSPVGPLRLDVARGIQASQTRLHFSVGITF